MSIVAASAVVVASCGEKSTSEVAAGFTKAEVDSVSYAVGVSLAGMVKQANLGNLNYSEMNKAIQDVLGEKTLKIDEMSAQGVIQKYIVKRQEVVASENSEKGKKFLEENKGKDSVMTTESGLQYKIITPGNEVKPTAQDTVEVHYTGKLIDGTVFDSSVERGNTVKFPLSNVIKGWTEGMQLIGEGGKAMLYIPAELGYGAQQMGPQIAPNSTLVFEVELIKVSRAKESK